MNVYSLKFFLTGILEVAKVWDKMLSDNNRSKQGMELGSRMDSKGSALPLRKGRLRFCCLSASNSICSSDVICASKFKTATMSSPVGTVSLKKNLFVIIDH